MVVGEVSAYVVVVAVGPVLQLLGVCLIKTRITRNKFLNFSIVLFLEEKP